MPSQTNVNHSRFALFRLFIYFLILFLSSASYPADGWQNISPGIEYRDLEGSILNPWSHIHVFRIDLSKNQFKLISAKSIGESNASVDQFVENSKGLIGINGGFFDKNFKPLGLRINQQRILNPLKRISWWGVFYVINDKAYISSFSHFNHNSAIDFAVQSGPRLIINDVIPSLKAGAAERTALGITADGKVIVLVTNTFAMTTNQLAKLMKSPPLSCVNAINLDGGSSSQLYAHINSFKLSAHGFSNVGDAIVISKK